MKTAKRTRASGSVSISKIKPTCVASILQQWVIINDPHERVSVNADIQSPKRHTNRQMFNQGHLLLQSVCPPPRPLPHSPRLHSVCFADTACQDEWVRPANQSALFPSLPWVGIHRPGTVGIGWSICMRV